MQMTKMTSDSWVDRNQRWIAPLVASIMLMLVLPLLQSLSTPAQPINIPSWADKLALVASCIGLAVSGLQARLTATLSAQLLCAAAVLAGYAMAIFLLLKMLGI